jgi:hypothetical protein
MPTDGKIKVTVQEALEHLLTRSVYQDRALLASAEVIKQLTLHLRNPGRYSEDSHRTSIDQLQAAADALRQLDAQWRLMHAARMGQPPPEGVSPEAAMQAGPQAAPPTGAAPPPPAPGDIAAQQAAALAAVRTLPIQPTGPARQTANDLASVFDPRRDDGAIM